MKPSEAFQCIAATFSSASIADKKNMFSNCIAELMIATNVSDEQNQMPSSIQTKHFAALQNVTALDVQDTRYSFDITCENTQLNRKRHASPGGEFFDDDPFNMPEPKQKKKK